MVAKMCWSRDGTGAKEKWVELSRVEGVARRDRINRLLKLFNGEEKRVVH
jgi:hypothetical protein